MTDMLISGSLVAWVINPETANPKDFDAFSSNLDKETLVSTKRGAQEKCSKGRFLLLV